MPVLLVRHAAAGSRRRWDGDDAARPLDDRGRRQAAALPVALARFAVARVLSSPAARCMDTVAPLGLPVEREHALAEGNGHEAVALVRSLLGAAGSPDGEAVVLCTHGDVIPEVLAALGVDDGGRCAKGSTWVLDGDGARYLPPPA